MICKLKTRLGTLFWCGLLTFIAGGCASNPRSELPTPILWAQDFEHDIRFQSIADAQLLVVGTQRHLYGLVPVSGAHLWRQRNVNPAQQDIYGVAGDSRLLVSDAAGGAFEDQNTHLLSLSKVTGELQWESPALPGLATQGAVHPTGQHLVIATLDAPHGDDRGLLANVLPGKGLRAGMHRAPTLIGLDLADGQPMWRVPLETKVRLRPSGVANEGEDVNVEQRRFDLNAFHPPFVVGSSTCVTYTGLSCYNTADGSERWSHRFKVLRKDLALSYAAPVQVGNRLLVTGDKRLRSFDIKTGAMDWRSDKISVMPAILADADTAYTQTGGQFYDLDRERWVWRGNFGAVATDLETGTQIWRFKRAKKSISNLQVVGNRVWLADSKHLFSLVRRTGVVEKKVKHRFKDAPVFAVVNASHQLVLISDSEVAAFDLQDGSRAWYVHYPKPKPSAWRRISAQLLRLSGGVLQLGSMAVSVSSGLVPNIPAIPVAGIGLKLFSSKRLVSRTSGGVAKNFRGAATAIVETDSFADFGDRYQYFLTQLPGVDGVALARVDIDSGATTALVKLPSSDPQLVIDDEAGILYQAAGRRLVAIELR